MDKQSFLVSKRFLENIDSPVFAKDIQGKYRYCNLAFAKHLALDKEAILGKTAYDLFPAELADIYTARDKALFAAAAHKDYDRHGSDPLPQENDGIFSKSILYGKDQSIIGFICMISVEKIALPHKTSDDLQKLTPRELDVFNLLVKGQPVKIMARELDISTHTIADHLKEIYRKLDVHSKNEAIYKGLHLFMSHPWQMVKMED